MNLSTLSEKFNTTDKCIKHLEDVRWGRGKRAVCPVCEGQKVYRRKRKPYWHCNICNKDFTVLFGTIFEASKLRLPKWFQIIAVMLNAKKGVSAAQLSRLVGVTYKTAWFTAMRVRCAMADEIDLLEGIVEMDEAYIGGKPRYRNKKGSISSTSLSTVFTKAKRGRGTSKIPIVGIVQRRGPAVVKIMDGLTTKNMLAMLKKHVKMDKAELMTDEFRSYTRMDRYMTHSVIKHVEKEYVRGRVHTNTIEGLWSIIKNGIKGQYHALSRKYLPFYLTEFTYKYNKRYYLPKSNNDFKDVIKSSVNDRKCVIYYKPNKVAKRITGRQTTRKKNSKK
jgi:transposase-like protein